MKLKYGITLKIIDTVLLGAGVYWLIFIDGNTLFWNSIIGLIIITYILLFILHPKYINLFYKYFYNDKRIDEDPRKAVNDLKGFIPYAIVSIILFYIVGNDGKLMDEVNLLKIMYVLSFIIYQLSFLRGSEDFIKSVENLNGEKPLKSSS